MHNAVRILRLALGIVFFTLFGLASAWFCYLTEFSTAARLNEYIYKTPWEEMKANWEFYAFCYGVLLLLFSLGWLIYPFRNRR